MKITYSNDIGESIKLTNSRPFIVQKIEGFGAVRSNLHMQKSPFQDGSTLVGKNLETREIVIEGTIVANTKEEIAKYRRKMIRVFNPKNSGVLIYCHRGIEKKINVEIEFAPVFANIGNIQNFIINMLCPSPFWEDLQQIKKEIALWVSDFEFPLEVDLDGIELGHREPSVMVNVFNDGDIKCGMRIEFMALATVKNPSILNVNTREYMKINKTMKAGEIIVVTTGFGNKRIESRLNGVTTNAFNCVDLSSTFLQLNLGDNLLRYDADENVENLEMSIYFTPGYLGV